MDSILIVEDDLDIQALIAQALSGFDLHFAEDLEGARRRIRELPEVKLVLLDLSLPDGNGFAFCTELGARRGTRIPVIFLTGSDDSRDVVTAFSLGAADFVRKPFVSLELRARVVSRLRESRDVPRTFEIGNIQIDADSMRTYRNDGAGRTEILLTPTEHRLLQTFAESPGRLFTRESLLSRIWMDAIVGHRTIDTHVSNLRSKLGDCGIKIESVRGLGYRVADDAGPRKSP